MRIGVTGDTHGSSQAVRRVVHASPEAEMYWHTGDYAHDAKMLHYISGKNVSGVRGNCDAWFTGKDDAPQNCYLEIEGFNVWITHGHLYDVDRGTQRLAEEAKLCGIDVVVYGHTHVPLIEEVGGVLIVNPGSPALPRQGYAPTMAMLTLVRGEKPLAEIMEVGREIRRF